MWPVAKMLSVLLAGSLAFAGAAGAQEPRGDDLQRLLMRHCGRLIWQFDGSVGRLPQTPTIRAAKTRRDQGEKSCNRSKPMQGIPLLEQALSEIGVNPLQRP